MLGTFYVLSFESYQVIKVVFFVIRNFVVGRLKQELSWRYYCVIIAIARKVFMSNKHQDDMRKKIILGIQPISLSVMSFFIYYILSLLYFDILSFKNLILILYVFKCFILIFYFNLCQQMLSHVNMFGNRRHEGVGGTMLWIDIIFVVDPQTKMTSSLSVYSISDFKQQIPTLYRNGGTQICKDGNFVTMVVDLIGKIYN